MKRLHLFCGHYGSGKTNLAVNFALHLQKQGYSVSIADIDIVNPYFRTKDSEKELEAAGVRVISLPFANTNVDLPALPAEVYSLVQDHSRFAVFDIGGDDRGAYALGRYVPDIQAEGSCEMYFVVNFYRPLTQTAEAAMTVLREIEAACGLNFTAVINNSNLGADTTVKTVTDTAGECGRLCELSGLPLAMTSAEKTIAAKLPGAFPLDLQKRPTA